jgi:hypothetical protein
MRVHNLYADASGQSHWRDLDIELGVKTPGGLQSKLMPATGIIFRQAPPNYELSWHPAPRRQYIINLDGGVELTASDGEARVIGAGEIILVEDTHGKGHLSKAVEGKMRHCIFVPVD